ncbi:MAG: Rid family detoxifying hydrolase [Oscillospiraceae bacterium]|nr:Rid family detoxifying hydrolase [Oscillospiraceae bacterium]
MREIIFTEHAPFPLGPYSQAVVVNGFLFASGQIAVNAINDGDGDIARQTDEVCRNIRAVLAAADLELTSVIKTTCFLAEMSDFAAFNAVYERYFAHKPARSCVAAKELPKSARVEIEVIALCV